MKIYTADSARCEWCQIQQIENGFIELGHEITENIYDADLIYQNNPWFDNIISSKKSGNIKGKIIFNILDLATNVGPNAFDINRAKNQFQFADAITCISDTVKIDCENRLGISPSVIYNPIQSVSKTGVKKYRHQFLLVGRVADPNKRISLAIQALNALGIDQKYVVVTGSEMIGYGDYAGVTKISDLNDLYNSVEYVMVPTRHAYLGLPIIEAIACGKIPIICNDLDILDEFFPADTFPEYRSISPTPDGLAKFIYSLESNQESKSIFKNKLWFHYKSFLEEKFSSKDVARRILDIYKNISL